MAVTRKRLFVHSWILIIGLLLLPILPVYSLAAQIQVPADYPNIQSAIDAAQDGDTIVVQPGIYTENINFNGKAIVITSTDPLNRPIVSTTIIDGNLSGSVVTFDAGETSNSIISGFTIRGGNGTLIDGKSYGGGIYIGKGCSPTIRQNIITGNTADIGGAIYIHGNSPPTITNGPNVDYPYIGIGQTIGLSVTATDPDGDDLVYNWVPREGGTITGEGSTVSFSAACTHYLLMS